MDKTTAIDRRRPAAAEKREALNWLARRLSWENRLGQLRPSDEHPSVNRKVAESKQAA